MRYLSFLSSAHDLFNPETYLEIGVRNGVSLSLSKCRSIGIDPAYSITAEIQNNVALFRTSSDEYFSRPDPLGPVGGKPFDLSFVDGLHLFEFALRDFINAERSSSAKSIIILDDVLPRSIDEAARVRRTTQWTGDVFRIIEVLAKYRPEVTVVPVGTQPTGLLLVMGIDPGNETLSRNYNEILKEFRSPDPQAVSDEILDRINIVPPGDVLRSTFWSVLAESPRSESPASIRQKLDELVREQLGSGFVHVAN